MAWVGVGARRGANARVVQNLAVRRAVMVVTFALLTAIGARIAIPLDPVPITLQTLVVTLAGALLGPYLGAAALLTYLVAGLSGIPVFALGGGFAYLLGPSGGYLLSFPLAAALTGLLSKGSSSAPAGPGRLFLAMAAASALILLVGWAQFSLLTGDPQRALADGVMPFLIGDALKCAAGALIAWRLRPRTLELV